MRRLVIGCGYLGERVARVWRAVGDEVYATTRGARVAELFRQIKLRAQRAQKHRMAVTKFQRLFQRLDGSRAILALVAGFSLVQWRF